MIPSLRTTSGLRQSLVGPPLLATSVLGDGTGGAMDRAVISKQETGEEMVSGISELQLRRRLWCPSAMYRGTLGCCGNCFICFFLRLSFAIQFVIGAFFAVVFICPCCCWALTERLDSCAMNFFWFECMCKSLLRIIALPDIKQTEKGSDYVIKDVGCSKNTCSKYECFNVKAMDEHVDAGGNFLWDGCTDFKECDDHMSVDKTKGGCCDTILGPDPLGQKP